MAAAADPGSESARVLTTLVAEITQDRVALIKIMGTLGIPVRGYKVLAGWAGRVKLNGHLLRSDRLPSGTAVWTQTSSTISSSARNASRTRSRPSGSVSRNGF
jgi:hypothetical protein